MRIEHYNGNNNEWDEYVKSSSKAILYHLIGWKSVIENTYGHKSYYLMARDNGKIKGILPLFLISSRLFGTYMISLPFACIGGVCADDKEAENLLVKEAIRITNEANAEYLELRQTEQVDMPELYSKNNKATFILQLDSNPDVVWKDRFCSNLRNKIKKAQKANLQVSAGTGKEYIEQFYNIFAHNMRDLGTPVFSKRLIENIVREFPGKSRIFIAKHNGRPIGGKFAMFFKDTVYFIWASSLRDYFKLAPVSLLNWEAIRYSCYNGIRFCDFGRSSINDGTYHFKRQFGGKEKQLYWQYYINNGSKIPDLNVGNKKFSIAANIWKRLPVSVTKLIGPRIVKHIP